jgi:hypothetical protein
MPAGGRSKANQAHVCAGLLAELTMSYPSLIAETVTFVVHNGDSGETYYATVAKKASPVSGARQSFKPNGC